MINKSTFSFRTILFVFIVSSIYVDNAFAQENGIYEISRTVSKNNNGKESKSRDRFYDLAFNLHPTHYIKNKELKTTYESGDPIKMTFEDSKSFNWLNNNNSKKDSLEIIIINLDELSDLNQRIDFSNRANFNNLKYVFIRCSFICTEDNIKQFIQADSNVRIFYTIAIGG